MGLTVAVFGLGYVGATSTACLARLGHRVIGVDPDPNKVDCIANGKAPLQEPGIDDLLAQAHRRGAVSATTNAGEALQECDACFVCVGTPSLRNGAIDTSFLRQVVGEIAEFRAAHERCIPILTRSTALPSVHRELMDILARELMPRQPVGYCVHPEFLREGQAVTDFFEPSKIVFGCTDEAVRKICQQLYPGIDAPVRYVEPDVAAVVKYADNCFHAVKVTFANEIGLLAHSFGVDSRSVMDVFCLDTKLNISTKYLRPGMPYGGSCLPKDLRGVISWARQEALHVPMLEHVPLSNEAQIQNIISQILHMEGRRIGMIGLAFKDQTDDLRDSPMVTIAEHLLGKGRSILVYDNNLMPERLVGSNRRFALESLPHLATMLVEDCHRLVEETDLVILARACTPVPIASLPWKRGQTLFDLVGLSDHSGIKADISGLFWPGSCGHAALRTVSH